MELKDIKRGDILVADYRYDGIWSHKKNYIIFIASGEPISTVTHQLGEFASIPILAHIDLADRLSVCSKKTNDKAQTIGFTIKADDCEHFRPSILSKPTVEQYRELMSKLAVCGYKYNKHTKSLEKIKK